MKNLATFIRKYSKLIIIFTILLSILSISQIRNLVVDDDITEYLAEGDPEIEFYEEISEKFGSNNENITLIAIEYGDLFELENLQNFKYISEQLEKSDYIASVNSFLNMPKIIATDFGIEVREFVEVFPETRQEARQLEQDAYEDELIRGSYLSPDGKAALLMAESVPDINGTILKNEIEGIVQENIENALKIEYHGYPIMDAQITEMATDNMSLVIIAAIIILALLYYSFRSIQGTIFPALVAILSSLLLLGAIAASGKTVTIIISVIPVVMLSLVTAYGIHFISRYYEERQHFAPEKAIEKAITYSVIPIMMSALTTMAGFASLVTAIIIPMTEFGIFATIGIFVAFLLVIFFLGAIFNVFAPKKVPENFSHHSEDLITRFLNFLANSIVRKKVLIISIIIVVVIVSGFYVTQVKPDSSIEARLGLNNPITKSMDYFKDKFGGVDFLYVYTEAENVKHPYILRSIDKIQNYAKRLPSLSQPASISIFLTQLNEAMENKKIIPANPAKIDNLWFFAEGNEFVDSMIKDDDQSTVLQVRSREMTSLVVEQSIQKVEQFIQQIPKTVKGIDISQLSPEEKEQYYPYIAEDIITSWQANGTELDQTQSAELKEELIRIAGLTNTEFIQTDKDFIEEIISLSSLELEDFGITAIEIEPVISGYLKSNLDSVTFINRITNQLEISEYDAGYLQDVIDSSIAIAGEREKIQYAREQITNIFDLQLTQDNTNYLWYLTDDYVYVPDQDGDISSSFSLTGMPVITNRVNDSVYQGQIKSMLTAFVAVFILLAFQFSSIWIGLIAMIPIILTILTSFGIMGIANISLNIGTMMVASVAIGAGIDYTIHFINRYKDELKKNNRIDAMKNTMIGTGRAIVFNSISVAAGLIVLSLSKIEMISIFGKLISSVMLISVVYTLLLLPILLNSVKFKEEKDVKQK